MSNGIFYISSSYKDWLSEVKSKVRSSQIKAALAVNAALIDFYWDLGKMIVEKLQHEKWGNKVIEQLAKDLKAEFSDVSKVKVVEDAYFYITQTIENDWSRDTLALQIKTNLHQRQGKASSNFKNILPEPFSDLAQQTLKDPYVFDFLLLSNAAKERDMNIQIPISNYQISSSNVFSQLVPPLLGEGRGEVFPTSNF